MARLVPWFFGVFALGIVVHLSWAISLLDGDDPLGATPLHTLGVLNRYALIVLLVVASAFALWSLAWPIRSRWGIAALVPQQILLLVSGGGSLRAIVESSYADGVLRPTAFIFADQMPVVLLAVIHTCALLWLILFEARRYG